MAFWGIEVKPGRPITHSCEKAGGRLRISQATLGIGEATKKSIVQCNVGSRSPVLLCVLLPDKTESCHLDLEFEETDDVVFSVIGPRSVYLTGYYIRQSQLSNLHSDTESYGMDIENTQTDGSSYCSDDDKYEDSFINDDDELRVSTQSPVLSGEGLEDAALENDKPKDGKACRNRLKKKYRVIESDDDANSHESEDEDGWSLSAFKSKKAAKTAMSDAEQKIAQVLAEMGAEAKGDGVCESESKQKVDPLDINGNEERATKLPLAEEGIEVKDKKNELPTEVKTIEETKVSNEEVLIGDNHGNKVEGTIINQNLPMSNAKDQSLDVAKPKKKRKAHSMKEEKTCEVQTENKDHNVLREDNEHEIEASVNLEIGANDLVNPPASDSVDGRKSKKRRNELQLEGMHPQGIDEICQNNPENGNLEQEFLRTNSVTKDLPAADGEYQEQQRLEETCTEEIGANGHNIPKEEKFVQSLSHADNNTKDLPAANEEYLEQNDNNINIKSESLINDSHPEKKRKKKMKKRQGEIDVDMGVAKMTAKEETALMDYEDQTTNPVPIHRTTVSNGLIIEELTSGPPDGKVAALGKKVKIYYTATLKESGRVFESNVDKAAFRFRLGDEGFIDAWNVGIDGMRVGDKRRLIVPPSMGFGANGVGELVPPNSWVVYDIELVGVRK